MIKARVASTRLQGILTGVAFDGPNLKRELPDRLVARRMAGILRLRVLIALAQLSLRMTC